MGALRGELFYATISCKAWLETTKLIRERVWHNARPQKRKE